MTKILKVLARLYGLHIVIFFMASTVEYVVRASPQQGWPVIVRDHAIFILASILILLLIADICLYFVQVTIDEEPWSYEWNLWRLVLEIIAGLLAATSAVFANAYMRSIPLVIGIVRLFLPGSLYILFAVLAILTIGIPMIRYGLSVWRYHEIRIAMALLARLEKRYGEHLSQLLPSSTVRFPIGVEEIPEAVRPLQQSTYRDTWLLSGGDSRASSLRSTPRSTQTQLGLALASAHDQLLILSEPGGGKSTQLYLLAHKLVRQAQIALEKARKELAAGIRARDHMPPIQFPIIIDTSILDSYFDPPSSGSFETWFIDSFAKIYGVQKGFVRSWLRRGRFLPMLDSLDVLNETRRRYFVERINFYIERHSDQPLIVCSRQNEYIALTDTKFQLFRAVKLLRPTREDVLRIAGTVQPLNQILQQFPHLIEELRTPMLLSLALATFAEQAQNAASLLPITDLSNWRTTLCRNYLRWKIENHPGLQIELTEKALAWLGYQLKNHEKVVFYLEDLQHDWLPSLHAQRRYRFLVGSVKLFLKVTIGPLYGVFIAELVTIVFAMNNGIEVTRIFGSSPASNVGPLINLISGVIGGLGLGAGIGEALSTRGNNSLPLHMPPGRQNFAGILVVAAVLGILTALAAVVLGGLGVGIVGDIIIGGGVGIFLGVILWLMGGLPHARADFQRPNHGLRNAMVSAIGVIILFTLVGLTCGGLIVLVLFTFMSGAAGISSNTDPVLLIGASAVALTVLTLGGLNAALSAGGASAIQHVALERTLARSSVIPHHFGQFLALARTHAILYREGGGYSFSVRSKLLRDCFAEQYEQLYAADFESTASKSLRMRLNEGSQSIRMRFWNSWPRKKKR